MRLPKGLRVLVVGADRDSSRNYAGKVAALAATIPPGEAGRYDFEVRHGPACPAIRGGGYCACDPDVSMTRVKA